MCTYAVRSIAQRTASHIIQLVDTNDNKTMKQVHEATSLII
jgi:predicted DCC family thiol-disulfide oxidoreductase YuxK